MVKNLKNINFVQIFLALSLMAAGLFYEFTACIAGAVLCIYLIYFYCKNKELIFYKNITSISLCIFVLFYGLTAFWGVDKGTSVIGFFKFLPIVLFMIVLMQHPENNNKNLEILPHISVFMTIVSAILMQFSTTKDYFSAFGRLSGFLQYPNTFAILLLLSLLIIVTKEKMSKLDYFYLPVLLFGILYSGSRTVFAITVVAILVVLFRIKNKKIRISLISTAIILIGGVVVYVLISKDVKSIGRFLTGSLSSSTFIGRLLYFYDAIPLILKHPFGLGYLGYNFVEPTIQTGVYYVKFIHNDFLQFLLDIGWVPTILMTVAILKSIFTTGISFRKRIMIICLVAHSLFDFNLQYIAIFFVLIMLLNYDDGKEVQISFSKSTFVGIMSVILLLFAYMGTAQTLSSMNQYEKAIKIYPWDTQSQIAVLSAERNVKIREKRADIIIKSNKYVTLPYQVKARIAMTKGKFFEVIENEEKAISLAPFNYDLYEEYATILIGAINLYDEAGDMDSKNICIDKLLSLEEQLSKITEKQSSLAKKIKDQPKTEFEDEIKQHIEEIKNA